MTVAFGTPSAELSRLPRGAVDDLAPRLRDFADTAAAVGNLDLIITVDTAVAHLAGALARPTWIMLPFVRDWRWLTEGEESPWYASVRLFQQPAPHHWEPVVARIAAELKEQGVTANIIQVRAIDENNTGKGTALDEIVAAMQYLFSEESAKINGARLPLY